jgi:shikimate dehydrogenase
MTRIAGLIGYPLAHSVTPQIYGAVFTAMGIAARCEMMVTPPEALKATVARLREQDVFGSNVTVPHKEAVIPLLDEVDGEAGRIGAVNCIVNASGRLVGHNTDLRGFIRSLREAGFDPAGRSALLLGAGGGARSVAVGLADAGVAGLALAGRSLERVQATAASLGERIETPVRSLSLSGTGLNSACREADLIVNCTPVGTRHTPEERAVPIAAGLIRPGVFVFDLVYNPPETPLLAAARRAGARTVSGLDMLVYQGAESIRLWTGREAPIDIMRDAGRLALAASA